MTLSLRDIFDNKDLFQLIAEYCENAFNLNKLGQALLDKFLRDRMKDAYHAKFRLDFLFSPEILKPGQRIFPGINLAGSPLRSQQRRLMFRHYVELSGQRINRPPLTIGYHAHFAKADHYQQTIRELDYLCTQRLTPKLIDLEQMQLLNYLFLHNKLNTTDIDLAIYNKNLAILGLFIANEFNQTPRAVLQDSRKKSLKFRQGFALAMIASLLNYGFVRGIYELSTLIDTSSLEGILFLSGVFIKNAIIYRLINPTQTAPITPEFIAGFFYYTVCVSALLMASVINVFFYFLEPYWTWSVLYTVWSSVGIVEGVLLVSLINAFGQFQDNDITNNYGNWVNTVLLSLPARFIFALLAQPLFAIAALGLALTASTMFLYAQVQKLILPQNCLIDITPFLDWCSQTANRLYEVWLDSISIRTVQWNTSTQTALDIIRHEVPEQKTVQEDAVKHVDELMVHARSIMLAETDHNHNFTPKEQLSYLLKQYLNAGGLATFFAAQKPHAGLVKRLLGELDNELVLYDNHWQLMDSTTDTELRSIGRYVKYVLLPMEDKIVAQQNIPVPALPQLVA